MPIVESFDFSEDRLPNLNPLWDQTTETIDISTLSEGEYVLTGTYVLGTPLAMLLDALPIPALLMDESYVIIFANKACGNISPDYRRVENRSFSSLFPRPKEADKADILIRKVFLSRKAHSYEGLLEIEGGKIWSRMHLRSLRRDNQTSVLALVENLTLEKRQLLLTKKHEEQLKIAQNDLERLVEERTAELLKINEELRKAREELEDRVEERTAKLKSFNEKLRSEIGVRRRTEKALKDSQEKYRIVVENANDGIIVHQQGKIHFVNKRFEDIIGYSNHELKSKDFFELIHPEDRKAASEADRKMVSDRSAPRNFTYRVVDRKGRLRWLDIHAVAVTWQGTPATLSFLTDTTSKRKLEEEVLKIQKLESVGVLAGGIAHDFNNILTAVQGNISLAKIYMPGNGKALGRLKEAGKACKRAQSLTNQLMTFAKGGAPIKQSASIAKILREACEFAVRGSNVRCEFVIARDTWPVEVDEAQISQVFSNLVINADQAMPHGGTIYVSAENVVITNENGSTVKPGKYVRMSVRDEGVGISPENLLKIFDPYFTTKKTGSGLGLASTFFIIQNHEGSISVTSKEGVGTKFVIYLAASQAVLIQDVPEDGGIFMGQGRILVMDDETSIRDLTSELLSMLGYEAVVAKNGTEAMELYLEAKKTMKPFDAVILDLTVPGGMGGNEFLQQLLRIDKNVKAIVSSGYSNDPIMAECEKYGFKGVIPKPYDAEDLSRVLRRVMYGECA
ncbi:MAG: PAS domain S-box protein [Desulfomonile tiedjei]|uniref:histidine kinase n=1 Tax=Desulfomonile tiedjei TaxID=2358 RepID=A0A9D6V333_9BACT|nr:PAS domain S-box protein [Desulfomonile tiedjei]